MEALYTLEEIEAGRAVLLPLAGGEPVTVPKEALPAEHPADGMVFALGQDGRWQPREKEARARGDAMRDRMAGLLAKKKPASKKSAGTKKAAPKKGGGKTG